MPSFSLSRFSLNSRALALLHDQNALSEISPLPGFSHESLNEALEKKLRSPSYAFALDSLKWQKSHPIQKGIVHLSGLVLKQNLDETLNLGFKKIKIKVADYTKDELLYAISWAQNQAQIHLDANRSLSFEEALDLVMRLPKKAITYFEEPVKTFEELKKFSKISPFPLALDETLREHSLTKIKTIKNVQYWVLKPTLMGGFKVLDFYRNQAYLNNVKPLLSSSFESAVGIMTIAHVALTRNFPCDELGLDTSGYLSENFFQIPRGPRLDLSLFKQHCPLLKKRLSNLL